MIDKQLKQDLIDLCYKAGDAILKVYAESDFGIVKKADDSPVTRADQAANDIICSRLNQLTPNIPIISEENGLPTFEVRKTYRKYWLVDPLDGTKEFIKKNGEFTVNIALINNGISIAGFVYAPVSKVLYWAAEGVGAYKISASDEIRLECSVFGYQQKGLTVACSRSHQNTATKHFIQKLDEPSIIHLGSSLKIMKIAEGLADIYPKLGPISEWDIAASHVILSEAGGQILTYPEREPVLYNQRNSVIVPHFIAEGNRS